MAKFIWSPSQDMQMPKISTGALFLDTFLEGGYDDDIVTTIYGPAGAGKTNLCLLAAVQAAKLGKKILFLDTEGGIAVERLNQLSNGNKILLDSIFFFQPYTWTEQKDLFARLKEEVNERIGLIIVDSISMLYRLELGNNGEVYDTNAALGKQIASLVEIARKKHIPVLVTSQVYADFQNQDQVKIVGGDLLKYGSKCLIELQKLNTGRIAVLRKHRSLPEGKEVVFRIVREGVEEVA